MDELAEIIEALVALNNRALALNVNISAELEAAAQKLNAEHDARWAEERSRIECAFRRPQSDSIQ